VQSSSKGRVAGRRLRRVAAVLAAVSVASSAAATAAKAPPYRTGAYKGTIAQTFGFGDKVLNHGHISFTVGKGYLSGLVYDAGYVCDDAKAHGYSTTGFKRKRIRLSRTGAFLLKVNGNGDKLTLKGTVKGGKASGTINEVFQSGQYGQCGLFESAKWTAKHK